MVCIYMPIDTKSIIILKKGVENMHKANKIQRDKNVTVWMPRKYHKKIQRMAFNKGVSITWILDMILKDYFGRSKKKNG